MHNMVPCDALPRPCPICESNIADPLCTVPLADGLAGIRAQEVVSCSRCGFVYANSRQTQAEYDRFYAERSKYADATTATGSGDSPYDADRLRATADDIAEFLCDPNARILDIGCATGGLLQALAAVGFVNLTGMDPSPDCAAVLRHRGFRACAGSLDTVPEDLGQYDCVILCHVLEHVKDLAKALHAVRSLLKQDGLLYLETPDATRYGQYLYAPFQEFNTEHINHFSLPALANLARRFGFKAVHTASKIFLTGPAMEYPAIFGLFRMQVVPAIWLPESHSELRGKLKEYAEASAVLLHRIDDLLHEVLGNTPKIIVWGTGQLALKLFTLPSLSAGKVLACTDSNPLYHGKTFAGVEVVAPVQLHAMPQPILIASVLQREAIIRSIHRLGLTNEIVTIPDSLVQLLSREAA